ncbi:MAG TPA: YqgE/AlgH family protein [Acidimicrobiales bacterium]
MAPHDSTAGKLLIAEPMLEDPNFDRTVVLMIEHTPDGALGVVLNRPTELEVDAVLGEWSALAASPPVLYMGGPVEQNAVLALARRPRAAGHPDPRHPAAGSPVWPDPSEARDTAETPGWTSVVGDIGTIDLHLDPDDVAPGVDGIRFFAGYSGWGGGQLEAELEEGAWLVVDATDDDVFAADPDAMWRAVLRRQGGRTAMLEHFPSHPSLN